MSLRSALPSLRWLQSYERVPFEAETCYIVGSDQHHSFLTAEKHDETSADTRWRYLPKASGLHLSFMGIHLAIWWLAIALLRTRSCNAPRIIHSPASDILEHVRHVYNDSGTHSYYIQPPSPEIDQRWHELILGNFVRLSPEDLQQVGRLDSNPVLLDDGSGVGLVNAHHEIHCVMSLYHASHPEYYWPNATAEQLRSSRHHVDHCLDYLLQASMCHGDVGFMTYHWQLDRLEPYWREAQHSCVNWDGLREWMKGRKVPIHEPGFLVHPRLGPVYPNGAVKVPTSHED